MRSIGRSAVMRLTVMHLCAFLAILPSSAANLLPAPSVLAPTNNLSNVTTPTTFSWTSVSGANSGYRLFVATSASALPTDPAASSCNCLINATPTTTSYSTSVLQPGTTYYWEVHARSTNNYGSWSPIYKFTTLLPTAAKPSITPQGGAYATPQTVTITTATPNGTVYYTTNGSVPSTSSTRYSAPIVIATSMTINAVATAAGFGMSPTSTASFTVATPATAPIFSPSPGTYSNSVNVTLSNSTPAAAMYYTVDGSTPTTSSTKYTSAILVTTSRTVKAIAVAPGYAQSSVSTGSYTVQPPMCSANGLTAVIGDTAPCDLFNGYSTCQTNIVTSGESTVLQVQTSPVQAGLVGLSAQFGAIESPRTGTDGKASALYSAGPAGRIGSGQTIVDSINGSLCGKTFSNLATVYNYNSFNINQSVISPATYSNSLDYSAADIQKFFESKGSVLANLYLVGSSGGFVDSNNNGKYDAKGPRRNNHSPVGVIATLSTAANFSSFSSR